MGDITFVVCADCKVKRDLGKFYSLLSVNVVDHDSAMKFSNEVETDSFRFGLLGSFMQKHLGHSCSLVLDSSPDYNIIMDLPEEDFFERRQNKQRKKAKA